MSPKDFFFLVKEVREAQKAYFLTRSTEALKKSKDLEAKLDAEIETTLVKKGLKEKPHEQLSLNIPPQTWTPSRQIR